MTSPAHPWIHPDAKALAKALGVTMRQITAWRIIGAPLPATGPLDELAVRLWHAGTPGLKALAEPTGPLAPYATGLAGIAERVGERAGDDPADALKREQRKRVVILNAKDQQSLVSKARGWLSSQMGAIEQKLRHKLTSPLNLDELRRIDDPAVVKRKIEDAIAAALTEVLP